MALVLTTASSGSIVTGKYLLQTSAAARTVCGCWGSERPCTRSPEPGLMKDLVTNACVGDQHGLDDSKANNT